MDKQLEDIERQIVNKRNFDTPPLHLWHPELSGEIDIEIRSDGSWWHEGDPIRRESIVRLFASILRREDDGDYYLVTPGEKWRIRVQAHALLVTDVDREEEGGALCATLNTGRRVPISEEHPLYLDPACDHVAAMRLAHGLTALFNRPAWYRLVEMADDEGRVHSGGYTVSLAATVE